MGNLRKLRETLYEGAQKLSVVIVPGVHANSLAEQTCVHFADWIESYRAAPKSVTVWNYQHDVKLNHEHFWDSFCAEGGGLLQELLTLCDSQSQTDDTELVLIGHRLGAFILKSAINDAHQKGNAFELLERLETLVMIGDPDLHDENRSDWTSLISECFLVSKAPPQELCCEQALNCLKAISDAFETVTIESRFFQISGTSRVRKRGLLRELRNKGRYGCVCNANLSVRMWTTADEEEMVAGVEGDGERCVFHKSSKHHKALTLIASNSFDSYESLLVNHRGRNHAIAFIESGDEVTQSASTSNRSRSATYTPVDDSQNINTTSVEARDGSISLGNMQSNTDVYQLQTAGQHMSNMVDTLAPQPEDLNLTQTPLLQHVSVLQPINDDESYPACQISATQNKSVSLNMAEHKATSQEPEHANNEHKSIEEAVSSKNRSCHGANENNKKTRSASDDEHNNSDLDDDKSEDEDKDDDDNNNDDDDNQNDDASKRDDPDNDKNNTDNDDNDDNDDDSDDHDGNNGGGTNVGNSSDEDQPDMEASEGRQNQNDERFDTHQTRKVGYPNKCQDLLDSASQIDTPARSPISDMKLASSADIKIDASNDTALKSRTRKLPLQLGMPQQCPQFIGRQDLLQGMEKIIAEQHMLDREGRLIFIQGVAGIGKSQLASEFVYRSASLFDHVFWINANNDLSLAQSFHEMAIALGLIQGRKDHKHADSKAAIASWLQRTDTQWLMVFDNADDLEPLQSYSSSYLRGTIIITSRQQRDIGPQNDIRVNKLYVPPLTNNESVQLLLRATATDNTTIASSIVAQLGGHPLALSLACAYINQDNDLQMRGDRLAYLHRRLQGTSHAREISLGGEPLSPVAAILDCDQISPIALSTCLMWSCLDCYNLKDSICLRRQNPLHLALDNFPTDEVQFYTAKRELINFNFCQPKTESQSSCTMHRAVQQSVRSSVTQTTLLQALATASELLLNQWPTKRRLKNVLYGYWPEFDQLFSHVYSLSETLLATSGKSTFDPSLIPWAFIKLLIQSTWYNSRIRGNPEECTHLIGLAHDLLSSCRSAIAYKSNVDNCLKSMPRRLIAIDDSAQELSVVETKGQSIDYVALSYTWGHCENHPALTKATLSRFQDQVSTAGLPTVYQDACKLARELGTSHLWIDSLCILQDDPDERTAEILNMANIYRSATYCIVSAGHHRGSSRELGQTYNLYPTVDQDDKSKARSKNLDFHEHAEPGDSRSKALLEDTKSKDGDQKVYEGQDQQGSLLKPLPRASTDEPETTNHDGDLGDTKSHGNRVQLSNQSKSTVKAAVKRFFKRHTA